MMSYVYVVLVLVFQSSLSWTGTRFVGCTQCNKPISSLASYWAVLNFRCHWQLMGLAWACRQSRIAKEPAASATSTEDSQGSRPKRALPRFDYNVLNGTSASLSAMLHAAGGVAALCANSEHDCGLCIHANRLCLPVYMLCTHVYRLCLHDYKPCMHDNWLCIRFYMLCMDVYRMYC